ncbi:MAG: phosphoribosyl-AMP cyclohydrolase [Actinobacteria bacterium]|jgi:phosphoribosyl-AMP cyclohydrolase|nr:phosphoribosyl-AMP cyclohydrolase [Actinomycetota bacterium]NDE83245.1 phosphoribosyl-AMP cyclohydrolase [Actinomycetota bacterium]
MDQVPIFANSESLIAAILQDHATGQVLMLGWMNQEAYERTLATKRVTFWSRSRNQIWIKGESSGNYQDVVSIEIDCDRDALLIKVKSHGPACHTGEQSCFHESID